MNNLKNTSVTNYHLLIADDEENTRAALARALQLLGYQVDEAENGAQVMEKLTQNHYDLLLLDLRMPELDGVQIMHQIRQKAYDISIIILTAHASLDSAISAIRSDVDDYLQKPKHINEIIEAIQTSLKNRRHTIISSSSRKNNRGNSIASDSYQLDLDIEQRTLKIQYPENANTKIIELTQDQVAILNYLIKHIGEVRSNQQIAQHALSYPCLTAKEAESIVRPHILRIRRKIEMNNSYPNLIRTIRGSGYILIMPNTQ